MEQRDGQDDGHQQVEKGVDNNDETINIFQTPPMELVRVKIFLQLSTSVIALDPRQCQIYFFKNGYENVYLR